jgi:hypothetical protein
MNPEEGNHPQEGVRRPLRKEKITTNHLVKFEEKMLR